ncbi:GntR family transcriptional regulator [Thermomonospora cellulosilytica]|uniref:DNA-binding GntR family transcriptional regulator n=1 Tax=Thermomonospora cellulosilytica TaxID=1411118 RepID=A0A7W3R7Y8_9ACTN|nr:GntR family transcriptional regulator [Thermomonospora cellulosilytica]MBA9003718.1 DNA-binding GntR family transcriptional regulator [Thermomonospora cellulosilytica]
MSIDHDDARAPYQQLADILRGRIASGKYPVGRRLPSLMELESEFDLNPKTIRKAIDVLRAEGLVQTSPGRGVFVLAQKAEPPADE